MGGREWTLEDDEEQIDWNRLADAEFSHDKQLADRELASPYVRHEVEVGARALARAQLRLERPASDQVEADVDGR